MIYAMSTILEMWLKITTMEMKYNAIWIQMIKLSREMICESMVTGSLQMLQASNGAMCIQTDLELFFFFPRTTQQFIFATLLLPLFSI